MSFVFWDKVLLFTYFIFWKQPTFLKVVEFLSGLASSKLNILVWCALVIIVGWFWLSKCMFVYLQHSLCKSKKIYTFGVHVWIDSEFGRMPDDKRVFTTVVSPNSLSIPLMYTSLCLLYSPALKKLELNQLLLASPKWMTDLISSMFLWVYILDRNSTLIYLISPKAIC
jgi:hypothetical protein